MRNKNKKCKHYTKPIPRSSQPLATSYKNNRTNDHVTVCLKNSYLIGIFVGP